MVEEVADKYKYPGVQCNTDWTGNATQRLSTGKGQSRLHFLRKLKSFNVCNKMLQLFYQSVAKSTIFFATMWWQNRLKNLNRKALVQGTTRAMRGSGEEDNAQTVVHNGTCLTPSLWPPDQTVWSTSSYRLIRLCPEKDHTESFLPAVISLFNQTPLCQDRGVRRWSIKLPPNEPKSNTHRGLIHLSSPLNNLIDYCTITVQYTLH